MAGQKGTEIDRQERKGRRQGGRGVCCGSGMMLKTGELGERRKIFIVLICLHFN